MSLFEQSGSRQKWFLLPSGLVLLAASSIIAGAKTALDVDDELSDILGSRAIDNIGNNGGGWASMNALEFIAANPRQTVLDTLDITVVAAGKDNVTLSMPVTAKVHQYTGILHGGVSVLLAETAAAIGSAFNTDLAKYTPVGIEINANHVRSISHGTVVATASPVYVGRQLSIWAIEIKDERDRLISTARCTMMHKPGSAIPA